MPAAGSTAPDALLRESEDRLRFLADAGLALASSLNYQETLSRVAELAIESLADFCFVDLIDERALIRRVAWAHRDPRQRAWFDERFASAEPTPVAGHPFSSELLSGAPIYVPVIDEAWMQASALSPDHLSFMRRSQAHSAMIVPIAAGTTIGAITFCRSGSRRERHTPEDLSLAMELGRRAGLAVAHARQHQALQESETRFRNMADSAPALIWMTDVEGEWIFANMHHEYMFGGRSADMLGQGWRRIVSPDDLDGFVQNFREAFAKRVPFRAEVRVRDRLDRIRWLRCEGVPRLSDTHDFLGYTGCNVDITETKLAAQHRELLLNELNHRVKNTLATVQAMAAQSLRNADDPEEAARALTSRLVALARAHDILTQENWEGANLADIVAQAAAVHQPRGGSRFSVEGPFLRLSPRAALTLSLTLHELATNATKYGALSNEAGTVAIRWERADDRRFALRWEEKGGPPVKAPTRRGFGTRLIEHSLAADLDGAVSLNYEPAGVVCSIEGPVA